MATVPSADGIAVAENLLNPGSPAFIVVNHNDGALTKVDLTTVPATLTDIFTGGSRGDFVAVGPDNCLYATQTEGVLRITNADGSCSFVPTDEHGPNQIVLSPATTVLPFSGTATLTAIIDDVLQQPVAGASATCGVLSGPDNGTRWAVVSDASGAVTVQLSGKTIGTDVLQCSASGGLVKSNQALVTFTAQPLCQHE